MTTVKLTEALTTHLRTLLFEDMHERAEYLAKAAHNAHEGPSASAGEDARCCWASTGMQESAALLDLIGWETRDEAARLSAVQKAAKGAF
ncbi:MAG: hypothetical protein WKF96_25580 [Solirubrobacteraceae bacterium]